jgi:hypothetical protein
VLADLDTGRTLEVIHDGAFILDEACFSSDENRVLFIMSDEECGIMKSPDLAEVDRRLRQTAINPELAAAATDLLDYREKLARSYESQAKRLNDVGLSGTDDQLKNALAVWEGLHADFPRLAKYGEVLAGIYESRTANLEEQGNEAEATSDDQAAEEFDWGLAREQLAKAVAIRKKLAADFPDVENYKTDLATSQSRFVEFNKRHPASDSQSEPE